MTIDELRVCANAAVDAGALEPAACDALLAALDVIKALRDVRPGTVHRALVAFDRALAGSSDGRRHE